MLTLRPKPESTLRKRRRIAIPLLSLLLLVGLLGALAPVGHPAHGAPTLPPGAIDISDVPRDVHRRAARHLEEVRGTEMAPGWESATLDRLVRPLYRPDDDDEPAYYEFSVFIIAEKRYAGFIIAAANENDFPIAHWSDTGDPPTVVLQRESGPTGYFAERFYKLDTLSYVGVDWMNELAAYLGDIPPRIEGLTVEMLHEEPEITTTGWIIDDPPADDEDAGEVTESEVITGPVGPPDGLVISGWESWEQLQSEYADTYAFFLEQQRREAAPLWEAEALDLSHGIVLRKDQVYELALLWGAAEPPQLEGPGADYIDTRMVTQAYGLPGLFEITVASNVPYGFTPFTVTLTYDNAVHETVRFQIVDLAHAYLPLVTAGGSGGLAVSSSEVTPFDVSEPASLDAGEPASLDAAEPASVQSWSAWRYFRAGADDHQRMYTQIAAGTPPNDSNCVSGCGPTAWAMLFGWADYQASLGTARWAPRWGIYRVNGGRGADAVAPENMDAGVRNMMWEIREDVGTYCAPWPWTGMAATNPWNMKDANDYLRGRTGARAFTEYSRVGRRLDKFRVAARDAIVQDRTPAVIGTGWLTHYPLAYRYRWRSRESCGWFSCSTTYEREFYVNQGYGGSGDGWIPAKTWFVGEIRP